MSTACLAPVWRLASKRGLRHGVRSRREFPKPCRGSRLFVKDAVVASPLSCEGAADWLSRSALCLPYERWSRCASAGGRARWALRRVGCGRRGATRCRGAVETLWRPFAFWERPGSLCFSRFGLRLFCPLPSPRALGFHAFASPFAIFLSSRRISSSRFKMRGRLGQSFFG